MEISTKSIKALAQIMTEHDLVSVEMETELGKLKLGRGEVNGGVVYTQVAAPVGHHVPATVVNNIAVSEEVEINNTSLLQAIEITAPMVGLFFVASEPGSAPFIKVGDKVKVGQVVCIIEAMKTMNEIVSDKVGEVVEILAENGQLVEFGQPLFRLK